MTILKNANLLIRFLLELGVLISIGYWAFQLKSSLATKIALGIGLPVITAIVWGTFVAPNSSHLLPTHFRLILELIIFGAATLALLKSGHPVLGKIFICTVLVNISLMLLWKQ